MKKITLSLVMITIAITVLAQAPQAFKYQAVARDNAGSLLVSQDVSFRISILEGSTTGTAVYVETHDTITNEQGLVSLEIGNGEIVTGVFADINWGEYSYFLQVEMDEEGESNYLLMGTSQLLSVPYSLYSESTGDTTRWRKNNNKLYYNEGNVGIGITNPVAKLSVDGSGYFKGDGYFVDHDTNEVFIDLYNITSDWLIVAAADTNRLDIRVWGGDTVMSTMANGNVGIGTVSPDESALLDLNSNSKGLLIPRMTQAEIEAISSPADGLQVYNIDDGKLYIFVISQAEWKEISYGASTLTTAAILEIGTGGNCTNTLVYGNYEELCALRVYEYVTIEVNVTSVGAYTISTDTINGYYFSTSGTFISNGIHNIDLAGSGIPVAAQTDNFTVTASNGGGTCTFGITVEPGFVCGTVLIDDRDGQSYNTVQIDIQCWMQENLNTGTKINILDSTSSNNGIIEKYCYNDIEDSCLVYGGYYYWNEMMEYSTVEGSQGICPDRWHIPSNNIDWYVLETVLTGNTGGKMKETGYIHWSSPNTNATNESDFTALPCGYYDNNLFTWDGIGLEGSFWSSNDNNIFPNCYFLWYDNGLLTSSFDDSGVHPVRCIKD